MSEQDRTMRASDSQRQEMADYLQQAMSEGRITADELSERTGKALRAKTLGDLAEIASDLPDPPGSAVAPSAGGAVGGGGGETTLRGKFGGVKRNGNWQVPETLRLLGRFNSFQLDFTEATIASPVVVVDIDMNGGSLEMRLPEGASASLDEVDMMMGSIEDHRKGAPANGNPHFRLVGKARLGSIEVRGPKRGLFGR